MKLDFDFHPLTPSSALDAIMTGILYKNIPAMYPEAKHILWIMKKAKITWTDAEGMLGIFVDIVFPDPDENESVKTVAMDILHSPENARDHYTTFRLKKKDGGFRTIEAPDKPLKKLLRAILNRWWYARKRPDECFQGFVPKRGTLTNANKHIADGVFGKDKILVKTDIRDFFMSITRTSLMNNILDEQGYSCGHKPGMRVPRILLKMMTEHKDRMPAVSDESLEIFKDSPVLYDGNNPDVSKIIACKVALDWIMLRLCCLDERLPQGSPCSPALANIFLRSLSNIIRNELGKMFPSDCRWKSTLYADDIVTTFPKNVTDMIGEVIKTIVVCIMRYPDLSINYKKIGVFRHGHPQKVTGIMITDKRSISRKDRDKVRAELHNAVSGKKRLTYEDKMRLRGVRAWMRGVDAEGWDSRCEKDFKEAVGI